MKRTKLMLVVSTMVSFMVSCEESSDPGLTTADLLQHTLDKIENNEGISYDLFKSLDGLEADSIERLKAASKTKENFVSLMADETIDYFSDVVESNKGSFTITSIPTPFSGEAEITLKGLANQEQPSAPPFLDIPGDYSKVILKELEEQKASGRDKWIPIIAFDGGTSESKPLPTESVSLNYEKVKLLASLHTIMMDPNLSDEETLQELDDILSTGNIPPVAVGMLLPAVQKVREAASTQSADPFNDALVQWLDGTVDPAINGGLNRDIIRRIQATAYLAGVYTLLTPEYSDANQDIASLSVLHARYRATIIMAAEEWWGD